jgi:hypothetical protein
MATLLNSEEQKRIAQQWNWAASQASLRAQKRKTGPGYSKASYAIVLGTLAGMILLVILLHFL